MKGYQDMQSFKEKYSCVWKEEQVSEKGQVILAFHKNNSLHFWLYVNENRFSAA